MAHGCSSTAARPYEPRTAAKHTSNAEQSLHALEKLGLDVSIEDSAKKKDKQ